ncbi:MAG: FeoA domain-containing protein [Deltaproteobacteria bacterium]|nr:FeoA domain-containing protein [Deltaproteobacteria bacterium]
MENENVVEEILEFIWTQREHGDSSISNLLKVEEIIDAKGGIDTLKKMEKDSIVSITEDRITLTGKGEKLAETIIRRHRLAERLLSEVLEIDEGLIEKNACSFEHSLSPLVTDSICTLLGHPPTCPHGLPIPRGECCKKFKAEIKPLAQPLKELGIGESGRIVFITPASHSRLDKLGSLGIVPGSIIKLHQKKPSFVIEIGETMLALDSEIAKEIYVKKW